MMQSAEVLLFQATLRVQVPLIISEIRLNVTNQELRITLDLVKGATFTCPECAQACKVYESADCTWRHLNLFQFITYVYARLPWVQCTEHGIKTVSAPWVCPVSAFTLLFEALDQVCKIESKHRKDLKCIRYLWLKRKSDPSFLHEWISWVNSSTLEPMKKVAATIEHYWNSIIRWFESLITNGILECTSIIFQAENRKARGYFSVENLIAMIYLLAGKIDLQPNIVKLPI